MEYKFLKHKILILDPWGKDTLSKYPNILMDDVYKELKGLDRKKFKISEHISKLFDKEQFYGAWKNRISEFDTIIIHDGIRGRDVVEFIKKHNPDARIIFYFYNPLDLSDRKNPALYKDLVKEFYTFDLVNAKEFNLKFHNYYYDRFDYVKSIFNPKAEIKHTMFFAGADKGRLKILMKLQKELAEYDMKVKFHVLPSRHINYSAEEKKYLKNTVLSREDTLDDALHSNSILEFQQSGQSGITLRVMAAMLLRKKVITTNELITLYDFYNENNFLILDENIDGERIREFLAKPYIPYSENILCQFKPENWLESFFSSSVQSDVL